MTLYRLYLESVSYQSRTMVHVLDLPGCVAVGPTTEAALDATPEAINAFRRFLHRSGEPVELDDAVDWVVVEHVTEQEWNGSGSPCIFFAPEREPVATDELARLVARLRALRDEAALLAERPIAAIPGVRPASETRDVCQALQQMLSGTGHVLAPALRVEDDLNVLQEAVEDGQLSIPAALRRSVDIVAEQLVATPAAIPRSHSTPAAPRILRQALRRLLEHDWMHLTQLARPLCGTGL